MADLIKLVKDSELKSWLYEVSSTYQRVINKPFSIGVMGKSGAGKSSFINSLCQANICKTGGVGGCTREIQKIDSVMGNMNVTFYDFPGIAENEHWNKRYIDKYKPYLKELDIILWTIKVDDRSLFEDEKFYNEFIYSDYEIREKVVFILSQSDKAEPTREWDWNKYKPSERQLDKIDRNRHRIFVDFNVNQFYQVIPISTNFTQEKDTYRIYNFDSIFEMFLFKLNSMSRVSDQLSVKLSWDITKREMNKSSELMKKSFSFLSEEAEDVRRKAEELKRRLFF